MIYQNQSTKTPMIFKSVPVIILVAGFWLLAASSSRAENFTSPHYRIEWGNLNITSGKKNSATYELTDTVGQNAPGAFTNSGFIVKSGFQYIYDSFNKFSFRIDNGQLAINFGTLVPNIGVTDTNTITISSPAGHGYFVYARENHPLRQEIGITIPDTTCDIGSTCSPSVSGTWNLNTTYGFGFNAIGINSSGAATHIGTSAYFGNDSYFRPLANVEPPSTLTAQVIMSETAPVTNHSARITYKINVSAIQAAGDYENSVIFTAIPYY